MIYASGVVSFLSNNRELKSIVKRTNKNISLEVIKRPSSKEDDDFPDKISCKFTALLPRSFECKTLEDYTGKIKPFLQQSIRTTIVSVEISHLNYVSSQATHSKKIQFN